MFHYSSSHFTVLIYSFHCKANPHTCLCSKYYTTAPRSWKGNMVSSKNHTPSTRCVTDRVRQSCADMHLFSMKPPPISSPPRDLLPLTSTNTTAAGYSSPSLLWPLQSPIADRMRFAKCAYARGKSFAGGSRSSSGAP